MRRGTLLAGLAGAGLLALAPAAARAVGGDDLSTLLDGLAPAAKQPPAGEVAVTGWVEGGPGATELVVRVEPRGAARLVAEPGVTVTPLPREGVAWPAGPAVRDVAGGGYFPAPVELRLPFEAAGGGEPVEARVEYAYCLVEHQCLFGETTVRAVPPACAAAGAVSSTPC